MPSEEHLELVYDARAALFLLIKETEPGSGMSLHAAYRELKSVCDKAKAERREAELKEQREANQKDWRRRRAWLEAPMVDRERLLLQVLGGDRLTLRELREGMDAELPDGSVYDSDVRRLALRLVKARELDRTGEPRKPGAKTIRYRYFARRELDGPIADLDRVFHADGTEG